MSKNLMALNRVRRPIDCQGLSVLIHARKIFALLQKANLDDAANRLRHALQKG
jgi:hypothetical protein